MKAAINRRQRYELERLPFYAYRRIRVASNGCWIWIGGRQSGGYGALRDRRPGDQDDRQMVLAHRFVYEELVGDIPEDLQLDHLCRIRECVNPEHLEPVTNLENSHRGLNGPQEYCQRGHRFEGDNVYVRPDGRRECVPCRRMNFRRWKERQRNAS